MNNQKIIGKGMAIASDKIANDDFKAFIDTSDEWIYPRTGIKSRYFSKTESTTDLGYRAALAAINDAQIAASDIDLIIFSTMTPDNFAPSCACLLQAKLGLNYQKMMAFDLNAACTGFVYALEVASHMLTSYKTILVVGAEVLSKVLDFSDRNTCVLFGDGAGAVILQRVESDKQFHFYTNSIGDDEYKLACRGIEKTDVYQRTSPQCVAMDGKEVFKFAVKAIEEAINEVLVKAHKTLADIDCIIPHQANIRIIEYVAKKMNIPMEKFFMNIAEFGNTSSASIPIALAQAAKQGKITDNQHIILVGFGAGFTYGACYMEV